MHPRTLRQRHGWRCRLGRSATGIPGRYFFMLLGGVLEGLVLGAAVPVVLVFAAQDWPVFLA